MRIKVLIVASSDIYYENFIPSTVLYLETYMKLMHIRMDTNFSMSVEIFWHLHYTKAHSTIYLEMKTFKFVLLSSALVATGSAWGGPSWKTRSIELLNKPNVVIPEGSYTIKCNDRKRTQYHIASKNRIWHTLGLFGGVGALAAIPFYYIFAKGLLELTPDSRYAVEFIVQHAENSDHENAIKLQVAEGNRGHEGKYISERKLKKESKASYILAKAGPNYSADETQDINVHLRMISKKRSRWFRSGRRLFLSRRRKLRMAHHKYSEWTLQLKKTAGELEQELEAKMLAETETEDDIWADEEDDDKF